MFNDKYGLTQSVLEGRKTMTRRIINTYEADEMDIWIGPYVTLYKKGDVLNNIFPAYKIGEEVAVAQRYIEVYNQYADWLDNKCKERYISPKFLSGLAGWTNKMFVKSRWMPNRIRITNVKIEMLQDVSYVDAMREGLIKRYDERNGFVHYSDINHNVDSYDWQVAFAELIDGVSGKDIWESNPWVFVYEFELIKNNNF